MQPDADEVRSGLHSPYLRHLPEKKEKDPNESDLFRQMVEIGSRLTASAHGKHAFLSSFICASMQPDADEVRSGLHFPYLRHLPEKKKKTRTNRIFLGRWWSSSNLKRIIKYTILNHQINVFAFFRGIPKNDDKSSIFQYLYMLLVSNRCRHLRFARHNTQAILESVLLL